MATDNSDKKKRVRSPAYPAFGLAECIEKARAIYDAEDRHFAPLEALASHWEYKTNNSAFLQLVSSLKQFGLLDEQGGKEHRKLRLTDRALDILTYEATDEKWCRAVRDAALEPKIHKELWEKYSGKLPREDVSIRVYLIRERTDGLFNKDHVDAFINQFRDTIDFAGLTGTDTINVKEDSQRGNGNGDDRQDHKGEREMSAVLSTSENRTQVIREFPIPLMGGGIAVVKIPFPMDKADFDQLMSTLEAWEHPLTGTQPQSPASDAKQQGEPATQRPRRIYPGGEVP